MFWAEKRGTLLITHMKPDGYIYWSLKRGAWKNPWQGLIYGEQFVSHSRKHWQKVGIKEIPSQLSDFHTNVNSKPTWFSFFILLASLILHPYPLSSWPEHLWGAAITEKRNLASCVQEQSMPFILLWNDSDFTVQLPPNSTCLTWNSSALFFFFFFFNSK